MAGTSNPNDPWFAVGDSVPPSFQPLDPPPPQSPAAGGFQELIDRANHPMAVCDRELRYLAVNRRWKRDFGLEDRNLVGQRHSDLFPYLGCQWQPAVGAVLLGHPQECGRDQWVLPSNQPAWVRWHLEPWSSKRESIGGFTITCEVLAEAAPDPFAQLGRSLLRTSPHPFVRLDFEGRILEWNAAAQAWASASREAAPPACFWDAFCPEASREAFRLHFLQDSQKTLETKQFSFAPVWSHALPDGTRAAWAAHPLLDSNDQVAGLLFLGLALPQPAVPAPPLVHNASLAQLVESAPFGLALLDAAGRTLFANHEHASLLGLDLRSHESVDDWLRSACPHPRDADQLLRTWKESVWNEETTRTFALRSSDHRLRQIRFQPRRTGDGGLLLALSDVTDLHQKVEELQGAEEAFRSLFQQAQVGLALENSSGKIVHANPAFSALTRCSQEELRRLSVVDLIHSEDRAAVQARLTDIRHDASSPAFSLDIRLVPAPGSSRQVPEAPDAIVRLTLCGLPGTGADSLRFAYFLTDIVIERLKPAPPAHPNPEDPALFATLRRHALAFEHTDEAVLITDPSGRILDWNPAATRMFGYSRQAVIGKSFSFLFAPQQPLPFHHAVAEAFAETGIWAGTQTFAREDGTKGTCQVRYIPTLVPSSRSTLIIGFHRPLPSSASGETESPRPSELEVTN